MADRLQESVEIIRRDRDRSRDFLADVSHELRTPIAALRTFNELLMERAGDDPDARAEFLESSRQPDRAPRLAGPEPARALEARLRASCCSTCGRTTCARRSSRPSTSTTPRPRRRGVTLDAGPAATRRSGSATTRRASARSSPTSSATRSSSRRAAASVRVDGPAASRDGARDRRSPTPASASTPAELPRIFERFYRGSRANEARGSGSGLGLAIVRSIVDMHGGTVAVESRLGRRLAVHGDAAARPADVAGTPAAERADVAGGQGRADRRTAPRANLDRPSRSSTRRTTETSPSDARR